MSKDQTIRDVAYAIWESEGRPNGQDEDHWNRAKLLVEEEGMTGTASGAPESKKDPAVDKDPVLSVGGD